MEKREVVKEVVGNLLESLGLAVPFTVSEENGTVVVSLEAHDQSALLIGYHGETLNALQLVTSLIVFRRLGESLPLLIDVDGYRKERAERLKQLAQRACDKARFLNLPQSLPPMNAFERRLVHLAVAEIPDMQSESVGQGRERCVVIRSRPGGATDAGAEKKEGE